jgi:hypothetical protein
MSTVYDTLLVLAVNLRIDEIRDTVGEQACRAGMEFKD